MTNSKTIKDQAASAKRAATAIRNIVKQLEWDRSQNLSDIIGLADQNILIKAAGILARFGATKTQVAKKTKTNELADEQAKAIATLEAKRILETWPVVVSALDKVSFIVLDRNIYSLQRYLHEGLPMWDGKEATPEDWRDMLDQLVNDSQKNLLSYKAYQAVKHNKPISEVMSEALDEFNVIKNRTGTADIAKQVESKINPR